MRFELTRDEPIRLAGERLNHSATSTVGPRGALSERSENTGIYMQDDTEGVQIGMQRRKSCLCMCVWSTRLLAASSVVSHVYDYTDVYRVCLYLCLSTLRSGSRDFR